MASMTAEIRAAGPPADNDTSIAAQLQRVIDPDTGKRMGTLFAVPWIPGEMASAMPHACMYANRPGSSSGMPCAWPE